jgi:hypothetical protein
VRIERQLNSKGTVGEGVQHIANSVTGVECQVKDVNPVGNAFGCPPALSWWLGDICYDILVIQVQVQVRCSSVCGQVQPLDVALSNSVCHTHAIAVPGCLSVFAVPGCLPVLAVGQVARRLSRMGH